MNITHPKPQAIEELEKLVRNAMSEFGDDEYGMIGDLTSDDAYVVANLLEAQGYDAEIRTEDVHGRIVDSNDWKKVVFKINERGLVNRIIRNVRGNK